MLKKIRIQTAALLATVFSCAWVCAALPGSVDGQPLPSLAPMLEKATPAVVNISTLSYIREREHPLLSDPFFRHFFGVPREQKRQRENSLGSGVVINADKGYVITNHHVIDKADEIAVTLQDGRKLKAELVGTDPETDVALLQVPAEDLTALKLADSDKLRVGDFVVAVGNPFGLGQTVTSGIVSALGRSGLGIEGYEDFIQTDASINPGNSGGALVNLRGELVGINTAILAPSGGNVGIGFAIPANMVEQVVQHLVEFGQVKRGFIGLQTQDLTPELARSFGIEKRKGAVVAGVDRDSPAEHGGLKAGDIITAIDGQNIDNSTDLRNRIGLLRVGESVKLSVLRGGRPLELNVTIEEHRSVRGGEISPYLQGGRFGEVDIETSRHGAVKRVLVIDVEPGSAAAELGLRKGDVILSINRISIETLGHLAELLNRGNRTLLLRLLRNDSVVTLLVR